MIQDAVSAAQNQNCSFFRKTTSHIRFCVVGGRIMNAVPIGRNGCQPVMSPVSLTVNDILAQDWFCDPRDKVVDLPDETNEMTGFEGIG